MLGISDQWQHPSAPGTGTVRTPPAQAAAPIAGEDLAIVRGVRSMLRQAEQHELHAERGLVLVLGVVQPLVH